MQFQLLKTGRSHIVTEHSATSQPQNFRNCKPAPRLGTLPRKWDSRFAVWVPRGRARRAKFGKRNSWKFALRPASWCTNSGILAKPVPRCQRRRGRPPLGRFLQLARTSQFPKARIPEAKIANSFERESQTAQWYPLPALPDAHAPRPDSLEAAKNRYGAAAHRATRSFRTAKSKASLPEKDVPGCKGQPQEWHAALLAAVALGNAFGGVYSPGFLVVFRSRCLSRAHPFFGIRPLRLGRNFPTRRSSQLFSRFPCAVCRPPLARPTFFLAFL